MLHAYLTERALQKERPQVTFSDAVRFPVPRKPSVPANCGGTVTGSERVEDALLDSRLEEEEEEEPLLPATEVEEDEGDPSGGLPSSAPGEGEEEEEDSPPASR